MKIGITGSRDFKNLRKVNYELDKTLRELDKFEYNIKDKLTIITGGAPGVDERAINWCLENNVWFENIRPINVMDKYSYLFRNVEIVTMSDHIIAFWNGTSRGTKFTMDYANARGKKVLVIRDD